MENNSTRSDINININLFFSSLLCNCILYCNWLLASFPKKIKLIPIRLFYVSFFCRVLKNLSNVRVVLKTMILLWQFITYLWLRKNCFFNQLEWLLVWSSIIEERVFIEMVDDVYWKNFNKLPVISFLLPFYYFVATGMSFVDSDLILTFWWKRNVRFWGFYLITLSKHQNGWKSPSKNS